LKSAEKKASGRWEGKFSCSTKKEVISLGRGITRSKKGIEVKRGEKKVGPREASSDLGGAPNGSPN